LIFIIKYAPFVNRFFEKAQIGISIRLQNAKIVFFIKWNIIMKKSLLMGVCLFTVASLAAQEVSISVINDSSYVVSGGINEAGTSRTLAVGSFEYQLNDDYLVHIEGQLQRGENGSDDVRDIQAYSNIDEDDFSKLYEIWFQGDYDELGLRFKVGQVDANTEFGFVNHSGEFINSSMGFSPTILFLPTYPIPTLSMNVFLDVNEISHIGLGIYSDESNEFDEVFTIAEWQTQFESATLKLGAWNQTGDIDRLDMTASQDGTNGYYLAVEGGLSLLWLNAASAGWYSQLGYADDSVGEIDLHLGVGLVLYDTFNNQGDLAGIGMTRINTSQYLHDELNKNETSIEIFYRYQLNQYIALKPDIQYIISPGSDKFASDALVVTLRTEFSF
jgi:hypothetical protein